MKQIIQYQKTGKLSVEELPIPVLRQGTVLVQNYFSLISAGTERTSVETAQASMLGKAKSRPDLVKQVMENVKREGVIATYKKVQNRLDNYKELGYSCAGVVMESAVEGIVPGDRVACGGASANHAEVVLVPKNLVAKVPDGVTLDEASFTTVCTIAMQGVRQAEVRLGENVAVIGLGLIGLITIQLLKANGCRVIGLDVSDKYFNLALKLGCDECRVSNFSSIPMVDSFTNGIGTDAVIITAGTKSNEPVELSLAMARKRSKVIVVGAVGMNIPRSPFYEKEIDFRISCSYGPGRYDYLYEEKGVDYPVGFVRWTENRKMTAILDLMNQKRLDVNSLITHKIQISEGLHAYSIITNRVKEKHVGVLLTYPGEKKINRDSINISKINPLRNDVSRQIILGCIGAGNFAQSNLLPYLDKTQARFKSVVTNRAINAKSVAQKFGFENALTDSSAVIQDGEINTLLIATRHDSHAEYVLEGLKSGKNVFVEKPLAVTKEQLGKINAFFQRHGGVPLPQLMVGFNRRYSQTFTDIEKFFGLTTDPFVITYRVNAGFLPKTHWTQDKDQGGRIIGEVCHFIDTISFLMKSDPVSVYASSIRSNNELVVDYDNIAITIRYRNGSIGTIIYTANGDSAVPKEYCEIFAQGKTAIMNNFKETIFYLNNKKSVKKYDGRKGHKEELLYFIEQIKNARSESMVQSYIGTTHLTFAIYDSLVNNTVILLGNN